MGELWALVKALRALEGLQGEIWVIIDNQSVLGMAQRHQRDRVAVQLNCPRIWAEVRRILATIPRMRFAWVPSHGKKEGGWHPPAEHSEREWRALNDAADAAAGVSRDLAWALEMVMRQGWKFAHWRAQAALWRCLLYTSPSPRD